jgi:hypothetical protein
MDASDAEIIVAAELESVEDRLRCAVQDLEAAAGSLTWVEGEHGADWSDTVPTSMELRDLALQLRGRLHALIQLESTADEE